MSGAEELLEPTAGPSAAEAAPGANNMVNTSQHYQVIAELKEQLNQATADLDRLGHRETVNVRVIADQIVAGLNELVNETDQRMNSMQDLVQQIAACLLPV